MQTEIQGTDADIIIETLHGFVTITITDGVNCAQARLKPKDAAEFAALITAALSEIDERKP